MEEPDQPSGGAPSGQAWLASLPGAAAAEARAALASLPTDAVSAGPGLPLVIAAWTLADPVLAAALLEAWLATADANGDLSPPCPVVCQWAERIAAALPEPAPFVERILPALARCIGREFDRYDVKGTGLPGWPAADEALFPAEYGEGRFTVDLAVLLSNEAESFCCLAQEREEEFAKALDNAEGEQRELDMWLKETFWNAEESTFYRYEESGQGSLDGSLCTYLALAWGGRTPEMTEGLRPRAAVWDSATWPARAWVLYFALLLPTPHNSVVARMRREGLPKGATPVEAAAWGVLSAGVDRARAAYLKDIPKPVRWLDAHGRGLTRVCAGGAAALLVVLLAWGIVQRDSGSSADLAGLEHRARQAAAEGHHDRAAVLYGQAARHGHEDYFRYRQAGEWMHLGFYAEAETTYRDLLTRKPEAPNVRMNLALAVVRQERREEALQLYREFLEQADGGGHPELAARARLAIERIERQVALDRE